MGFTQTYKDFKRVQQITNVLFNQELGYFIEKLNLKSHLPFSKRIQITKFSKPKDTVPQRLRKSMEELGGSFVKLGQLLSLRADLVPKEYIEEFTRLQDNVKPFPYELVKQTIESELKKPLNKIFSSFEKTPIASASIGQVHEAALKDGTKVAVKVQRPGIGQMFETDIDLMYHLARMLEKHVPEVKAFNPVGIVQEFDKYTTKEMDYLHEAKNIQQYREVVKSEKNVIVPEVYWDYTTQKVLTMQFIDGVKINSFKDYKNLTIKGDHLANTLVKLFVKGVLYYQFFHADPHPGNILLTKDKKIALLDFGIAGRVTPELTEKIGKLYLGLVDADANVISDGLINIGVIPLSVNKEEFRSDLIDAWSKYYDTSLNQINMSGFFWDSMRLGRKYSMKFPPEYILLMKSMITTEGVIKKLNPEFNFVKTSKPIIDSYVKERTSTKNILKGAKKTLIDFKDLMTRFPTDAQKMLDRIQSDEQMKIDLDIDEDIKKFTLEMDRSAKRLTLGVLLSALVLASSMMILAKIPPFFWGLPLYSVIGLAISCILLLKLVMLSFKK
ncbi:AarF/ABC1/UbiB kinase family protein [Candidatus Woesearchaeota archaeon]|nr:AarF/ABC1/UbiB kinase family protein [Candidatus Woesearchaeota archaeon]